MLATRLHGFEKVDVELLHELALGHEVYDYDVRAGNDGPDPQDEDNFTAHNSDVDESGEITRIHPITSLYV